MKKKINTTKLHVRKGDRVKVLSGDDRGKVGIVLHVFPKKSRAVVENVNVIKRHVKPTAKDPQSGGIIEKEAPLHVSKLILVDPSDNKPTRIGRKLNDSGKLSRFSKRTGKFL